MTTAPEPTTSDHGHDHNGVAAGGAQPIRLRASDAERHATVAVLQNAIGAGLLTHEEGGERMTAAWAARFREDLPVLTADLPPAPAPAVAAPGWRHVISLTLVQARSTAGDLVAGGWRTRQGLAMIMVVLVLSLLFGLTTLHELTGGGPGGFTHPH